MALFNEQDLIRKATQIESSLHKSAPEIFRESYKSLSSGRVYDIFLSHKSEDYRLLIATQRTIEEMGYSVYVDSKDDPELDRSKVTTETADQLRVRMKQCRCLFFARTINSPHSVWMSWELGYLMV